MKLKTLKDLEIAGHDVVREEAIKWVKEAESQTGIMSMADFKKFHNITEEDLK